MGFTTPRLPDFDLDEWRGRPHHRRLEPLVKDWGLNGFGTSAPAPAEKSSSTPPQNHPQSPARNSPPPSTPAPTPSPTPSSNPNTPPPPADPHTHHLPIGPLPTIESLPPEFFSIDIWDHLKVELPPPSAGPADLVHHLRGEREVGDGRNLSECLRFAAESRICDRHGSFRTRRKALLQRFVFGC